MMNDSTRRQSAVKPAKPYAGFPMFAHPSGQWAKKIRGRLCYFGPWRDPAAALERLNRDWPYLQDGRPPPPADTRNGCTLRVLCNSFLAAKQDQMGAGDLSAGGFRNYYRTCEKLLAYFGKERLVDDLRPVDFASYRTVLSKNRNAVSLGNEINHVRILFKFAHDNRLAKEPVAFGQAFARPSARTLRRLQNRAGPKRFTREQALALIEAADVQMRAMIYLGLNAGFGNSDCATLPKQALSESGWCNHPRPKTEIPRRVPLWPETQDAVAAAIASRPKPADSESDRLAFLTCRGVPWVRFKPKADDPDVFVRVDPLGQAFGKLLRKLRINGKRGIGFYTLRRCFETYAGESRDQVAVDYCMGHVDESMAAKYRRGISDGRLCDVVNIVHAWLFDGKGAVLARHTDPVIDGGSPIGNQRQ